MTEKEASKRRPRGASPRGDFEAAKNFATASEEARVVAAKRKTELLREARLNTLALEEGTRHDQR